MFSAIDWVGRKFGNSHGSVGYILTTQLATVNRQTISGDFVVEHKLKAPATAHAGCF
jgi:hypothetical protein